MKNVYIITQKDMWDVINDLCNEDKEKQQEKTMENKIKKWTKFAKYGCTLTEVTDNEEYLMDVIEEYYKQDKELQVKFYKVLSHQMKTGQKATVMKTIQRII